ncbi:MAG TPA: phage tail tape measure protein, partial [Chlamydiales bacterium]|nr:phage tail tape measure protein [Chlamydiales bacterium]
MILDTFITLFKADTQELKKGVKEADDVVDKLEKKLSTSDEAATKIGNTFRSLVQTAIGPVSAFLTLGSIIGGIRAAEQYSESIGKISKVLGYSAEAIDSWSGAVERAGGSASSFQSTVASVDSTLQGLSKNVYNDAAKAFQHLGINVKEADGSVRNFMDILPELAEQFGNLSDQEAADLGKKIGLDYGTVMLLQKGQKEVDALIAREKEL